MFSIDGLVSGLDTTSIIEGLVSLQQSQVDRLNARKSVIQTEQAAFQSIEARIIGLRSTMNSLNRSSGAVFDQSQATSSNEDLMTVSAGKDASPGSYVVRVNSLARAHQLGSQSISTDSTRLTTGTVELRVGDRPTTTVTLDDSNNTLSGLVEAINTQSDDVSASVVFDQANNGNRILLTSKHTGASNEISITNNLAAASDGLVRPDFSGPAVQDAANAQLQLGSGAGAIVAEYDTNSIDGLIENVTLNLTSADPNKDVVINVDKDTEAASSAIREFVDEYNSLISFIDEQTEFNPETSLGGPLLGNRNVSNIKNQLGAMVTEAVPGLNGTLNRFSQIGVEIDFTGKLTVDSVKLNRALNDEIDGVNSSDVGRLFGLTGESDQSGVEFLLGSTRTLSSDGTYQVDILQAAERGSATASNAMANSIEITSVNNSFEISVDGLTSETLVLDSGTYSQNELAAALESRINHSSDLRGAQVAVEVSGGQLSVTSQRYGRSSEISGISGTAISALGFDGGESGQGKDVAGSFIVDGVVEAATGAGRVLIGDSENENTGDLQIRVVLDPSQVGDGVEANLSVTRGITSRLDQYFSQILDPNVGSIKTFNEDFELRIDSLDESIERVNSISEAKTEYLIEQFAALERVLSDLQSTSSFLTSQLAAI